MTQKWLFSPCEPFPQTPPPFMHVTVTFYFYSHLTSQLHGASLLYVDFILLVTWERRTRHWGNFNMKSFLFCSYISNESDSFILFHIRGKAFKSRLYWFYFAFSKKQWWMNYELCHFDTKLADRHQEQETQSWLLHVFEILSLFTSSLYILLYHSLLISM